MKIGFLNDPNEPKQINALIALQALFQKHGIDFVAEGADLILARPERMLMEDGRRWFDAGKPIVLLERRDSSVIDAETKKMMLHPNVAAVFKNRILRHGYLNNYPTASVGRYHGKIINDFARAEEVQIPQPLDDATLAKLKMVVWDIESSFAHERYEPEKKVWNTYGEFVAGQRRDIDVLYLGSSGVYNQLINWHRHQFIERMKGLQGLRIVTEGRYDYESYVALMRRTKVAVSPWGWGEWCWRDCEAIYFGCALVKPNTDFVFTYPDIFRDDNYYRCAADASDLAAAVTTAINGWENQIDARFERRRALIAQMSTEDLIARLSVALHDAYAPRR